MRRRSKIIVGVTAAIITYASLAAFTGRYGYHERFHHRHHFHHGDYRPCDSKGTGKKQVPDQPASQEEKKDSNSNYQY